MNLEFSLSILAAVASLISAFYSWFQVINKKKAEDTFVEVIRHEVNPEKQKVWKATINDVKEQELILKAENTPLVEMVKINQEQIERTIKRLEELKKMQSEINALIEKLDAQQGKLIIESINQPSEKGQIAYLEKILARINSNAVLEQKQ